MASDFEFRGTKTGRFTSSTPNLVEITKTLREFSPGKHVLVEVSGPDERGAYNVTTKESRP